MYEEGQSFLRGRPYRSSVNFVFSTWGQKPSESTAGNNIINQCDCAKVYAAELTTVQALDTMPSALKVQPGPERALRRRLLLGTPVLGPVV